ncbi:hypothetical protein K474DRAFT_1703109 [Panus rudis PR-1116 ss-1]|nr:hypothetical protein K474DRAFT_1703109 [Panus rudis PR-1116 ss-1]
MSNAVPAQTDARFETSAAWAEAEASNTKLANQVEQNAETLHAAAQQAAITAQHKAPGQAVDQLEEGLSEKTNQAAAEGQANVQGYVQQAKNLAGSAAATASSYIPSTNGSTLNTNTEGGVLNTLASTAGAAVNTAKGYVAAATNAAAPVASSALGAGLSAVETAKTTAAPYVQGATTAVKNTLVGSNGTATSQQPESVAPKTAPLESGPHTVDTPYPQTTTGQATKVGEV